MTKDKSNWIKIKLIGSPICCPEKHKVIVRSLGLKKINRVVERVDTPGFRGMVAKIPHLLAIVQEDPITTEEPLKKPDRRNHFVWGENDLVINEKEVGH